MNLVCGRHGAAWRVQSDCIESTRAGAVVVLRVDDDRYKDVVVYTHYACEL